MSDILTAASLISTNDQPQDDYMEPMPKRYLPSAKNYANDPDVIQQLNDDVIPTLRHCIDERQELEDEWMAIRNMEMQIHDANRKYVGRSQAYMPLWSRILATRSSALAKGLFPSDEYMDCVEQNGGTTEAARRAKAYVQWELERNAKIRTVIKPFLRQLESTGNSVMKYVYRTERRYEGSTVKAVVAGLGEQARPKFGEISYDGFQLSARNIMNWYIYPMSADSIDEATLVFEEIEMPMLTIELMGKNKDAPWININQVYNSGPDSDAERKRQDLQTTYGAGGTREADTKQGRVRTVQEVWTYMVLPADAYVDGEDRNCPIPVVIHLSNKAIPLCVMRNPYFHQRFPYRFQRYNTHPGMVYGYGTGRLVRHLQYQVNDFQNQTNDAAQLILNPIIKRNPAMMVGPQKGMRPGQTWDVTDVDAAIKFERPPVELIDYGLKMIAMLLNNAQDFSGAPPILSGMKSGASSTATGAAILQKNAASPIQDQVEEIEQETMVPLLYGAWRLGQQFRDKATMFAIAGQTFEMSALNFSIDAVFRYLASSQAVNSQQRAQTAIQFLSQLMPLMPLIMQAGYVVDPTPVLRRVYADGLGFRGFDEFIKPAQAAAGGPTTPGNVGGVMQEQGDRVRSALEQLGGNGGQQLDMAPGEGEEFMEVRGEADQMAAQQGSTYGNG
jgi:hypothetical protein